MKKSFMLAALACVLLSAPGCQQEMQLETTDKGPVIEILSADTEALFGTDVNFKVSISDEIALSTVKAQIFFDEEKVAETIIRTKENGEYEGAVTVPFAAEIPDGTATLKIIGQNIKFGVTEIEQDLKVTRPRPDKIYLVLEDGSELDMTLKQDYLYTVTSSFAQKAKAYIRIEQDDCSGTFGWRSGKNSAIVWDSTELIPFSNSTAGEYQITFDLYSFVGTPFLTLTFGDSKNQSELSLAEGSESRYITTVNIVKDSLYTLEGLDTSDWTIDPDWFTRNEAGKFQPAMINGNYCVVADVDAKALSAITCDADGNAATFNTDSKKGAMWLVGDGLGKPSLAATPGWKPENGICLSPVADNEYQITAIAGVTLKTSGINFKFFGQNNGWGPVEFNNKGDYKISCDNDLIFIGDGTNGADAGNIQLTEGKKFERGGIYVFKITWSGNDGTLTLEKTGSVELPPVVVAVNGNTLSDDGDAYSGVISLKKGDDVTISGLDDISDYYIDPDFIDGQKFKAADGLYKVALKYAGHKYATFTRMKDETTVGTIDEHTLWLMGWGVAHPVMNKQMGWADGTPHAMAEVEDMVFEFSGTAVADEHDDTTIGGRFRTDYLSFKYFGQNGWGREKGKILDKDVNNTVQLTERAAALIKDAGNFELADGVTLEAGATYVLRIDLSKTASESIEVIDFYKK